MPNSLPNAMDSLIGSIANLITKQKVLEINPDSIVFNAFSLISFKTFHDLPEVLLVVAGLPALKVMRLTGCSRAGWDALIRGG